MQVDARALDLRDCVRTAVEGLDFAVQQRALRLTLDLAPEPLPVAGDGTRLEQCIVNLLSNAVKFTPAGGTIVVRARAEALVSVIAATPADATMDSLTGKWAREMLTNTRLLLDSPAGDDPLRRRLLEDLETVLVQLVQRSGAATEERALLDRTLERTQLLTRLRTGAAGI